MDAGLLRRSMLVVAVAIGMPIGTTNGAPVPKGSGESKSWIGKTVLPKKCLTEAQSGAPGVPFNVVGGRVALDPASWEVKSEKGTRVEVFAGGAPYWVERDNLVPLADAVAFYTKAMKDCDGQVDDYAHIYQGWAKYLLGKPEEAVKDLDEFLKKFALGTGPAGSDRCVGLRNRGLILAELGKFDAAMKDFDEALKIGGTYALLNRGWAHELKGDYGKAARDYATVLDTWPHDAATLNKMARLRATCPDAALRDGKQAVKIAKELCERTENREGIYLDTLGTAYAETGDFLAAIKSQELAMEDTGYLRKHFDSARKRLRLYNAKKPFYR